MMTIAATTDIGSELGFRVYYNPYGCKVFADLIMMLVTLPPILLTDDCTRMLSLSSYGADPLLSRPEALQQHLA